MGSKEVTLYTGQGSRVGRALMPSSLLQPELPLALCVSHKVSFSRGKKVRNSAAKTTTGLHTALMESAQIYCVRRGSQFGILKVTHGYLKKKEKRKKERFGGGGRR